ncbi:MAG: hypothetical protein PSV26_03005 [Polaromonas sp.]|uniref:hypothetical protein n=1 Tax=Polaromonas sp. TaxID=1869339 RepID=UPI00248A650C|nr:hypothetical protein [Polaromonas sp.]MDI1236435.1 hypothetical protein [Polaromonas sp.]
MNQTSFSPYAPMRLRDAEWWQFGTQAGQHGFVTRNGQIAEALPQLIMKNLIDPTMEAAMRQADADGNGEHLGQLFAKLLQQRHWVPLVAQYNLSGKQIFDLDDNIVTMLRNTDVADCTLQDWHPPYDAFFVRFGKQDDMKLPFDDGHEYLDGAFVAVTPWTTNGTERRLKIGLTTVKDDGSGVMMPGYFVDFSPEEQRLSPHQAIDAFIARKFADLDSDEDKSERNLALIEIRKGEWEEGAVLLRKATELVINCLFYIESIGADKELTPGRDVPPELHVKWQQTPPMRRFKVTQKLGSEGYTLVRLMGDEVQQGSSSPETGRADVSTHWRRGHWRRQAHGPQKALIKRVWIRPVLVNPTKPNEDIPGHVYAVGGSGNRVH